MAEISQYAPGTPSWVDLSSPDPDGSARFYGDLFGWEVHKADDPEAGGYAMGYLRGKPVAGIGPTWGENMPSVWSTYVSVENADATAERVREAGGEVVMAPMDVLDVGRMAVFRDPTGAHISVWQPRAHQGAGIVNEPGTLCWSELGTRDAEAAIPFYEHVFGWEAAPSTDPAMPYTEWKVGGRSIGGMMTMGDQIPAEIPAHWMTYFAVEDADAAAARATELGGSLMTGPMDIPGIGRFAVLTDPNGAAFSVIALAEPPPAV
jgi:hypothetical protein